MAGGPAMNLMHAYLASRGLHLPDDVRQADALRFHPAMPFKLKDGSTVKLPAMVALMVDIITNEPTGVHRTALKPDGSGKAEMPDGTSPKKMYGPAKGAVVKLCADDTVTTGLGITEGIEDALTIICAGWRPMWAALTAGGIASFPVLPGIETLTIFGDADLTRLAAAQECQARWRAAGRECPIVLPPHDGTDWNAWKGAA
jgi:putative DNA primase/helicase